MNLPDLQSLVPSTKLYERSIMRAGGETFCFAKDAHQHYLLIAHDPLLPSFGRDTFSGEVQDFEPHLALKWCLPSAGNARKLRQMFPFTAPKPLGVRRSIGFGDRIGLAAPAHIRAARECGLDATLILAQQSMWEMKHSIRRPDEVLDAASWAVFQENHREPWGADADNLRTVDEARIMARAGFTYFTLDLSQQFNAGPGADHPTRFERTIAHVETMTAVLDEEMRGDYDLEISLAYAAHPTTRDDHAFLARALLERGIRMTAFAPCLPSTREKDAFFYRTVLELAMRPTTFDLLQAFSVQWPADFTEPLRQHVALARELGPYLISVSLERGVGEMTPVIGRECGDLLHYKTRDEGFLQALSVVRKMDRAMFDEMFRVVGVGNSPKPQENGWSRLAAAYGTILGGKDERGAWLFRTKLFRLLLDNEALHHDLLIQSDKKHFEALGWCPSSTREPQA